MRGGVSGEARFPFGLRGSAFFALIPARVNRLGDFERRVLPADVLQGSPAVRDLDGLVPKIAEVARAITAKQIEHLGRLRRAD